MFFITYLRRELRRRIRQAVFIALGLALGIGLVVTVTAASAGVKKAQSDVLSSLYGVGTDVTVTGKPPRPPSPGKAPARGATSFQLGPGGAKICQNGAASIPAVQAEIEKLLPGDTVTTASSLASQVTGSLSSTAKLANDLGRWLSILVLIAAFAVASLLTMAAVARRVREFGTLKALGWRSRRIIAQVMGESVVVGIIGGAAGVGLGFAGAAIITATAPKLSATIASSTGQRFVSAGAGGGRGFSPTATHTVAVPMLASVTAGAVVAAVVLAVAGGLLAGSFGS